jgi:hypothetical protein
MPDTILRFKLEEVRILLECNSCHSQVLVDPSTQKVDPASDLVLLRCPSCTGSADWGDIEKFITAIVNGMNSIRRSTKVGAGFCVTVPNANG